jgi:SpoVK/Ycf46/Vps4 family AAA+-type ATPase
MSQNARTNADHLFEPVLEYPDEQHQARFDQLVGIDASKDRLVKEMLIRLDPEQLKAWSRTHHGEVLPVTSALLARPPVFILAGDVGTGKTALAESVGDPVARALGIPVFAYRLSLAARGSGLVGEITTLVRDAFATVGEQARQAARGDGKAKSAFILVIDEADALAQSRDNGQMHHEDRAGVNALIRGIDEFTRDRLPGIVILCTNRLGAIDPAVQRRSAAPLLFNRPDEEQRKSLLTSLLTGLGVSAGQLDELVALTGERGSQPGYTYSDLTQRLVPAAVLAAFPDKALTVNAFVHAVATTPPTPRFGGGDTHDTGGAGDGGSHG